MKRLFVVICLLFFCINFSFAQPIGKDDFLGTWVLTTKTNEIEIIKENNTYFVIEYVSIKHELFFSGDGNSAVFVAFGKGPPGFDIVMLRKNGDKIDRLYFTEEDYDWKPSQYSYYRKVKK